MAEKFNPFKPNHPVYAGMFVGRIKEIERINKVLFQTKNSNPTNILIVGERGIGKSSLLLAIRGLSKGEFNLDEKYNFLTVDVSIDNKIALIDLARKINTGIERSLESDEKLLSVVKKVWNFLQRIDTKYVSIKNGNNGLSSSEIVDKFIFSLLDTVKAITSKEESTPTLHCKKDGLVILIDEADNASDDLNLGSFLKLLSEKLVSENCNQVLVILAGLPKLHDVLYESHESSIRIFEELGLSPLSHGEVKEVIHRGLKEILEKNNIEVKVDEKALNLIVVYSEGYPHFVQQIGYSAYEIDSDNNISTEDVNKAMFMPGGALDLIGNRYYKDLYYNKIRDESYRKILQIMAIKWNTWITKSEIKKKFQGKPTQLDNGLHALIKRNIILTKKGTKGIYRLQWASFAFWISNFTKVEKTNGKQ